MATPAVGISNVSKRFDEVVAVDDVSLDIDDGEFFSLLGPSGCGKTTILRMIAGLDEPSVGQIRLHGDDVAAVPPNRRPVNTVFQEYALFPHLDVADNVAFGLRMQGVGKRERRRRAGEALDLVRLSGLERRRPEQLSGGQRQRVALARALVNQPLVLLLDEPLAALDLQLRQEMQRELKQIQRQVGITFVFVTHDQEEALTMSDRIGVMNDGDLLQVGTPDEIYEHPTDNFVARFIGRTNLLGGTVETADIVCLANGDRVAAETSLPAGTAVTVAVRPERATLRPIDPIDDLPAATEGHDLRGVVTGQTYLGNSIIYRVTVDWMHVDVRVENLPTNRCGIGDDVSIEWDDGALTVIEADR
jgi:spermidine/putrescine transport system ATP-binding protein